MFRKVEDFVTEYKQLRDGTQSVLGALTDENMGQQVHQDHRTLGRIAWHLAITIPELMGRTGLSLSSLDPELPVPASADEIRDAYARASQELITVVSTQWEDETLLETAGARVPGLFGPSKEEWAEFGGEASVI